MKTASGKFTGVDFGGHCNQIDVSLKLIFSWRILRVSMIVVNPNGPLTQARHKPTVQHSQSSVLCIVHRDLGLKCMKR